MLLRQAYLDIIDNAFQYISGVLPLIRLSANTTGPVVFETLKYVLRRKDLAFADAMAVVGFVSSCVLMKIN